MMFKIDFERAFSKMDSDHLKAIRIVGNKLFVTFHKRKRAVQYYEGDYLHIEEAYNYTVSYIFDNKKELNELYEGMIRK